MATSAFRGSPPPVGLAAQPNHADLVASGFAPNLSRYIEHGIGFQPAPALQVASYTGAAAGGAPGGGFGPPGVQGAPVPVFSGFSNLQLAIAALVVGGVIYAVTR